MLQDIGIPHEVLQDLGKTRLKFTEITAGTLGGEAQSELTSAQMCLDMSECVEHIWAYLGCKMRLEHIF